MSDILPPEMRLVLTSGAIWVRLVTELMSETSPLLKEAWIEACVTIIEKEWSQQGCGVLHFAGQPVDNCLK